MNTIIRRKLANSKRRIQRRLDKTDLGDCSKPMLTASNIHDEIADRSRGIAVGGIGAIHTLVRKLGLIDAIDQHLQLLKIHRPYHESDHVLALAYLPLCGGTRAFNVAYYALHGLSCFCLCSSTFAVEI